MKNTLLMLIASLAIAFTTSCKKKSTTTEPVDPCANTVCLNGGTCVDGSCSCPTGYSGADCGTQKTPVKITVTAIKVTKFPAMNGTSTWDPIINTNPDIFVKLTQGANTLITSGTTNNVTTQVNVFAGVTATDIADLTTQLNIELWDEDTPPIDANDSMGNINFSIYNSTNHFPATLIVDNGTLTFELSLQYTY